MTEPHERYRDFLISLTPATLDRLPDLVMPDVRFADPFNDVRGVEKMMRIFRHMFETVGPVAFTVRHTARVGDICMMDWSFEATLRGEPWAFDGTSVVRFAPDGRVAEHIDYWDAARNFYERFPVIGWLLAWLRERIGRR